jgi:hypothetical protein
MQKDYYLIVKHPKPEAYIKVKETYCFCKPIDGSPYSFQQSLRVIQYICRLPSLSIAFIIYIYIYRERERERERALISQAYLLHACFIIITYKNAENCSLSIYLSMINLSERYNIESLLFYIFESSMSLNHNVSWHYFQPPTA